VARASNPEIGTRTRCLRYETPSSWCRVGGIKRLKPEKLQADWFLVPVQKLLCHFVVGLLPTEADRDAALRQRVCPVSGEALGSKGPGVKMLIGEFPLYLCREGCIDAVRQSPDKYLPQPHLPAAR
jgi:hypothetical protein